VSLSWKTDPSAWLVLVCSGFILGFILLPLVQTAAEPTVAAMVETARDAGRLHVM
jgi:hypothetical protein